MEDDGFTLVKAKKKRGKALKSKSGASSKSNTDSVDLKSPVILR